jgi:hypothetical protein
MSKGSAGKVYFVLYLAVILELLIIIVERDEAEESLHKRQKESMRIVQNILSQLQTGSGSSNMNVSPNDLIIIQDKATVEALPKDQRIKRQKTYSVKVSVTDVTGLKRPEGAEVDEEKEKTDFSLTKLGNVQDLTYQLFFSEVRKEEIQESAPPMPTDEEFKKERGKRIVDLKKGDVVTNKDGKAWTLMDVRRLDLNVQKTKEINKGEPDVAAGLGGGYMKPSYKLSFNDQTIADEIPDPPALKDTTFFYDHKRTLEDIKKTEGLKTRSFTVNYDPGEDGKPGWYKLRFFSSTNRIMGIDGGMRRDLSDEDQVNVGVVKLKVKALRAVKKELMKDLDGKMEIRDSWYSGDGGVLEMDKAVREFNEVIKRAKETYAGNDDLLEKITLYDYIEKLLTPGFSSYLDQNRGVMDIDVEVRKPDAQQAPPQISDIPQTNGKNVTITFDKLQVTKIPFTVRPRSYFKPGNPNVEIKPNISGWRIEAVQGAAAALPSADGASPVANQPQRVYLVFDKPVPSGDYQIKLSYVGGGKTDTSSMQLRVLPSRLDQKSEKQLASLKFGYGKRVALRSKLPPEAELPLQQFVIDYTLGNERTVQDNPYTEGYSGPYIPASAKKVKIAVIWKYPETGERVPLFSKEVEPEQTMPEINALNPVAEKKGEKDAPPKKGAKGKKPVVPDNFQVSVRGIQVDFDVPIDADNKDPNNSKAIRAALDNVEAVGDAEIDYSSSDTQIRVYNGDEPDPTSTWTPTASTFYVVSGAYNEGAFPLTIQVKDLPAKPPAESRILKGQIAVKVGARIRNTKAGKVSQPNNSTVIIPINIPYQ